MKHTTSESSLSRFRLLLRHSEDPLASLEQPFLIPNTADCSTLRKALINGKPGIVHPDPTYFYPSRLF